MTFYYMNLVTVSRVQRNPTVKAEIQMRNFEASIPVGFYKRIDNVRSACCVRAQQADLFKGEDKYSTSLWYIYSIPVRWKDIHDPDGKNSQITKKTCYVVLNTI